MPASTFLPINAPAGVSQPANVPCLPWIESQYHTAMTDGRMVEQEIGQLIYEVKKMEQELMQWIQSELNHIINAMLAALPPTSAPPACIAQVIVFIKQMVTFIDNVIKTVQAIIKIIALIETMIRNMVAMIQSILNAIALLLSQICNFHLPKLPSLAFLLGNLFNFQGFNLKGLKLGLPSMNLHFTFPQCSIQSPKPFYSPGIAISPYGNTITNATSPIASASFVSPTPVTAGSVAPSVTLPVNPALGTPDAPGSGPFAGFVVSSDQQADPEFQSLFLNPPTTTTPLYPSSFNPTTDFQGSLPAPASIINNYNLPSAVYIANIASAANLPIAPTVDSAIFKTDIVSAINLGQVNANRDSNISAAWIIYLYLCRQGRAGSWIPEYEATYQQYIAPSIAYLQNTPTPWNGLDPNNILSGPSDLPILAVLNSMQDPELSVLLWQLSYVEASLLGYTRNTTWDSSAISSFFGYTDGALDFSETTIGTRSLAITLNSDGLAAYPSTIMIDPAWTKQVNAAIAVGQTAIQNNSQFQSQNPSYRFIYDQFAIATEVDRYSQYWREWAANFNTLVASSNSNSESPVALPYVMNYWQTIDSAVNPLGDIALYTYLYTDAITRSSGWIPGVDVINLPTAIDTSANAQGLWVPPDDQSAGWNGISPNLTFDAQTFLSRPDIQSLPVTTQLTMLDLNSAWATALNNGNKSIAVASQEISNLKAIVANSVIQGFQVSSSVGASISPSTTSLLRFDTTPLDIVGNVTSSGLFTIQTAGSYLLTGTYIFGALTVPAVREVQIWINGVPVFTQASHNVIDQVTIQLNETIIFNKNDTVQIYASTNGQSPATLLPNFNFQCLAFTLDTSSYGFTVSADGQIIQSGGISTIPTTSDTSESTAAVSVDQLISKITSNLKLSGTDMEPVYGKYTWGILGSGVKQQPAATPLVSLTAVYTNADGKALPITPEIDQPDTPYYDGVVLNNAAANQTVSTALMYGQEYQITTSTVMPIQASASPSGVAGSNTTPLASSGNLLPGQILYVGPGGLLTHDFNYVNTNCRWIIAVGRATDVDKFIYQPNIPMDMGGNGGRLVKYFEYIQTTPALTWTFPNPTGHYVNISVIDTNGNDVARDLTFDGVGTIVLNFLLPTAGTAHAS